MEATQKEDTLKVEEPQNQEKNEDNSDKNALGASKYQVKGTAVKQDNEQSNKKSSKK